MPDNSQATGKSMWDFATQAQDDPVSPPVAQTSDVHTASVSDHPEAPQRRKTVGWVGAAIAVVAVAATGFIYTQNTPEAVSNTSVVAVPVTATPVAVAMTPAEPAIIRRAASAQGSASFGSPLASDVPAVADRSLAELATGTATLPPIANLPIAQWQGATCSDCHTWTQANLCEQGEWYDTHGDAAITRIGHPYGGDFKRGLANWGKQGCQ